MVKRFFISFLTVALFLLGIRLYLPIPIGRAISEIVGGKWNGSIERVSLSKEGIVACGLTLSTKQEGGGEATLFFPRAVLTFSSIIADSATCTIKEEGWATEHFEWLNGLFNAPRSYGKLKIDNLSLKIDERPPLVLAIDARAGVESGALSLKLPAMGLFWHLDFGAKNSQILQFEESDLSSFLPLFSLVNLEPLSLSGLLSGHLFYDGELSFDLSLQNGEIDSYARAPSLEIHGKSEPALIFDDPKSFCENFVFELKTSQMRIAIDPFSKEPFWVDLDGSLNFAEGLLFGRLRKGEIFYPFTLSLEKSESAALLCHLKDSREVPSAIDLTARPKDGGGLWIEGSLVGVDPAEVAMLKKMARIPLPEMKEGMAFGELCATFDKEGITLANFRGEAISPKFVFEDWDHPFFAEKMAFEATFSPNSKESPFLGELIMWEAPCVPTHGWSLSGRIAMDLNSFAADVGWRGLHVKADGKKGKARLFATLDEGTLEGSLGFEGNLLDPLHMEGQFFGEKISGKTFSRLLEWVDLPWKVEGEYQLKGSLEKGLSRIELQGKEAKVFGSHFSWRSTHLEGDLRLHGTFEVGSKDFLWEGALLNGLLSFGESSFSHEGGELTLTRDRVALLSARMGWNEFSVEGDLEVKEGMLSIASKRLWVKDFYGMQADLLGSMALGLQVDSPMQSLTIQGKACGELLIEKEGAKVSLEAIELEGAYPEKRLFCKLLGGEVALGERRLPLFGYLDFEKEQIAFDCEVGEGGILARLCGHLDLNGSLTLDERACHLGGHPLCFEGTFPSDWQLSGEIPAIAPFSLTPLSLSLIGKSNHIKGVLGESPLELFSFDYERKSGLFHAEIQKAKMRLESSGNLSCEGLFCEKCSFEGEGFKLLGWLSWKKGDNFCQWQLVEGSYQGEFQEELTSALFKGHGELFLEKGAPFFRGSLGFDVKRAEDRLFSEELFVIEGRPSLISLELGRLCLERKSQQSVARINAAHIEILDQSALEARKIALEVDLGERHFQLELDRASLSKEGASFLGRLNSSPWNEISDFTFHYDEQKFGFEGGLFFCDVPLKLKGYARISPHATPFSLFLEDEKKKQLKIEGKATREIIEFSRLSGELEGLTLDLSEGQRPGLVLGYIALDEESHWKKLAPWLIPCQIHGGVEWLCKIAELEKGFSGYRLFGRLQSKELPLFDLKLCHLVAHFELCEDLAQIWNLKLSDPRLSLSIKEALLFKEGEQRNLMIPKVEVDSFYPSSFWRMGKFRSLVIRKLLAEDLFYSFGDSKSLKGRASLHFESFDQRDGLFSPTDLLAPLGFDPALFVPVQGDLSFSCEKGRLLCTGLDRCFSEGNRSRFYLVDDENYLDLEGNLSFGLKVRQYSLFRWMHPFKISIRGTLKEPTYKLE